jgi:signal peptidase I
VTDHYKKSSTRDTFESLVVTVILAIFGTTFVLQAFKIPTGSMEKTLLIGDHLLVNKFCFAPQTGLLRHLLPSREVRWGDVVVFKFPGSGVEAKEPGEHFVKRVIGLPGDRIRIVNRRIFVNGKPLQEAYAVHDDPEGHYPGDDFPFPAGESSQIATLRWSQELPNYLQDGELVVPPGHYFVMGDNREHSWDSRFWGFVPRELISGRPLIIYWSFETPREEYIHTSLSDRVEQTVDLILHFLTKTRWRRTFALVR